MLANKQKRRNVLFFNNRKIKEEKNISTRNFEKDLLNIHNEFVHLFKQPVLARDYKFLRKMSIIIKQIHYSSKTAPLHREIKWKAKDIEEFLENTINNPFTANTSLVEAALSFSEQDPQNSDISEILEKMTHHAPKFSRRLLQIFSVR